MALIPCRECGQQVSFSAKSCPQCGAPDPSTSAKLYAMSKIGKTLTIWITVPVVILFGLAMCFGGRG